MAVPMRQSTVWQYYILTTEAHEHDGVTEMRRWARCKKCNFKARAEPQRGTTMFWMHLRSKHSIGHPQLQGPQVGEGGGGLVVATAIMEMQISVKVSTPMASELCLRRCELAQLGSSTLV